MVGPLRPMFVLFGSSIVQFSYTNGGWGAHLTTVYSRQADIVLRGYSGWNSKRALAIVDQVFPQDAVVQPDLVITYFGGNDAMEYNPSGTSPHVPLEEYIENMRKIALHLKGLSDKTRLIFLSCPPLNEEQYISAYGNEIVRTNETSERYSEALLKLCKEIGVKAIDLFNSIRRKDNWQNISFTDGIHLSAEGSSIVAEEIEKVLKQAEWEPSLNSDSMPTEFP
ncbi:hypothetical protein AQUCO_07600136v1 [Aquilegia coerulea]|uniref:Uncharacterized protein n=1 Tax=Aquilegia coerulea TaxID=218851 RepID=A0A2G5C912_AQUCA|nr:hypothetical protein AQUCO_07600136v1 [Aquilegia coerulea]